MDRLFAPSLGLMATAGILGGLLAAILPTCLYLYVEPRGRLSWAVSGDTRSTRRAPAIVRLTAWSSFAVGQFALPWLFVPAACSALLYVQARLGIGRPFGWAATIMVGAMALIQSLLASRMLPLGVRLLTRDARLMTRMARICRTNALANGLLLALGVLMSGAMAFAPGLVHPWLRAALAWTALRPVMAYAVACLVNALLLGQCAVVVAYPSQTG